MLLGSAWLFNSPLDQQLTRLRAENPTEEYGFDFDERAVPSDGWFAIHEGTGIPVEVAFSDPVTAHRSTCFRSSAKSGIIAVRRLPPMLARGT